MKSNGIIGKVILLTMIGLLVLGLGQQEASAATAAVNAASVNVRSGPGTDYDIMDGLTHDTRVEILQVQGDWSQVRYGGQQGWIKSEYLQPDIELIVTGATVNLRSGPGTTYGIAGELAAGDKLILLGVSGEWYKVRDAQEREGYIFAELAARVDTPAAPATPPAPPATTGNDPSFGTISSGSAVNVRSGPGTDYDAMGRLTPGTDYPLLGDQDDWYRIRFDGSENAWVASWLVERAEPLADPAASGDITVLLNGQAMSFEVAPIIENGRTLVPLRAIFEALGATVSWDEATRTVTAAKGETVIVLPIGSLSPTVNGVAYPLDTAATIVNDRTLAPLRFVGEALGSTVSWDDATRTVDINMTENALPAQVIVRDNGASLRNGPGGDYDKLGEANAGEELAVIAQRDGWYQISREGELMWIASWLADAVYAAVTEAPDDEELSPEEQAESDTPADSARGLNTRGDENATVAAGFLSMSTAVDASGYRLVMKGGAALDPEIEESNGNRKIVMTFADAQIEGNRDELAFYIGTGKNSRIEISGQTVGATTWVTIEMPLAYAYDITREAGDTKVVFTILPQLLQIQNVKLNNGNQILEVKGTSAMTYEEKLDDHTLTVELTNTLPGFAEKLYNISGRDLADTLLVEETEAGGTLLTIELGSKVAEYMIMKNSDGNRISIALIHVEQIISETPGSTEGVIVWIDAGHGGAEPGCISDHTGVKEKDVNLPVALKVQELLEQSGLNVMMTRTDDSYVLLNDRAALANAAGADLFVSIHANSVTSYDPHGTQTHYYAFPEYPVTAEQEYERALLAELIQESMIKYCERNDRGVRSSLRESNLLVLRETVMPSVLVEMAFMSNPEEAALLVDKDFQELAARAIAEGIEKYIKIML
ncbi:MAG: N-acetylmuramoyl-L-alanine amidase [Syntrophomonadaceae bacterium]|nr:N-acetylmuramoyl-L-alanine amidase [Syntrophomonadaceae bacterium]